MFKSTGVEVRPTSRLVRIAIVTLIALGAVAGCGDDATPTTDTKVSPIAGATEELASELGTESIEHPTVAAATIEEIAADIALDVGGVVKVVNGDPNRVVYLFEESHDARAAQVEIAIMLNRLYEDYNVRLIGLEGAIATDGRLDVTSFHTDPPFEAKDPVEHPQDVVAQLLEQGEISSAEAMALIYRDIVVQGTEDKAQYEVDLSDEASAAATIYLYKIANSGMAQSEIQRANDLISEDKVSEAIDFIISTDPFTDRMHARMTDKDAIIPVVEWLTMLDEIEAKATEVGAELDAEDRAKFEELRQFFETAKLRSETMVAAVTSLQADQSAAPVAMIIGAAHTEEVVDLLSESGVSLAVLRAQSFRDGELSSEAYTRKLEKKSVDADAHLGALLDGRRKPPPVVDTLWFQVKSFVFAYAAQAAAAAANGQSLEQIATINPASDHVTITPLQIIDGQILFSIETVDANGGAVTLYGRAAHNPRLAREITLQRMGGTYLEQRLLQAREMVLQPEDLSTKGEEAIRIDTETVGAFAEDLDVVEAIHL